ncbi:MAG: M20/M25/M40 family metallo-hydrolase [Saprospiraceae bacterium]
MPITSNELDQLTTEAIALLSELIGIPALSKEEENRADFLQHYLIQSGFKPRRIGNNILLSKNNIDSNKCILLNSHIDTVKPSPSWSYNPHKAFIKEGKLFGLGANDAGASVVSLFMAFKYLSSKHQSYSLLFAATAEEEISGENGIAKLLNEIQNIDLAIVGEPTGMQMAIAEKGLMVIDAVTKGRSGHAAREEGVNAIYLAIADIETIKMLNFEKTSPLLGKSKATVTIIHAGSQHNVVPDECRYVIDVRCNEMYTLQEVHSLLQHAVKYSALTPRSFRLQPSSIDVDHEIIKKGISMGLNHYGSPTLSDQALMPFPSLKIGPGDSSRSHTADEYIELDEIKKGIQYYIQLMDSLDL